MKFSAKLAMGCITLLAGALCAAGLALVGGSFSGSLQSTRAALQAQQTRDAYAVERSVFSAVPALGEGAADGSAQLGVYADVAAVVQTYAEQTGGRMACWAEGQYTVYSNLPQTLTQQAQRAAVAAGAGLWRLERVDGVWYLLLSRRLALPGLHADLLCAYDVSSVFRTRDAQLHIWLAVVLLLLAIGGGAAVLFSRAVTGPMTALQQASGRIAAGQYSSRTRIDTDDEIGALSRSFDAMADAVEQKIAEMEGTLQSQRDFIAAFSHEVKTPMTAMLGYADLMRAKPPDAALQKEAADYIYRETRRLEDLSRHLLALMALEQDGSLTREPVTDTQLFAQTVRSLPPGAERPQVIPCGCTVQADRVLLCDLLRNLLLNAQQACRGRPGAAVTVSCRRRGTQAVFAVTDTGCGIPAADLPRLTEPFYMVDKSRARAAGGSGIGLALCRRIAELHQTQLVFESVEGSGTTVTLALPLWNREEETP